MRFARENENLITMNKNMTFYFTDKREIRKKKKDDCLQKKLNLIGIDLSPLTHLSLTVISSF